MIEIESKGSFKNLEAFLDKMSKPTIREILSQYGRKGVYALSTATPSESGISAESWDYKVDVRKGSYSITWTNSNVVDGVPVVILLQYGHATGTGGYVEGYDFINPAIKPVFNTISEEAWKAVKSA